MANGELLWFKTSDVDGVPSAPGLYAWYAVPIAGPLDWQPDFDANGHDRGGRNFGSFLAKHTRSLRTPTMGVEAKGHLWSAWSGTLTEVGTHTLAGLLDRLAGQAQPNVAPNLHWTLQNAPAREVLATVLVEASPRLSAPV